MTKKDKIENFEKEYKLSSFNVKWFEPITEKEYEQKNKIIALSEKPRKIWTDIIKRFFSNKWNVLFLTVFLSLIILILVGQTFSSYSSTKQVSTAVPDSIKYLSPFESGKYLSFKGTLDEVKSAVDGSINWTQGAKELSSVGNKINIINSSFDPAGYWTINYENPFYVNTIMGTDATGISVWQRLMSSAKFSFSLAITVATVETIIGTIVGLYLGYHAGKWIDTYFMRLVEIISSIPSILLTVILVLILGRSFGAFLIALVAIGWIGPVYVTRMFTMKVKDSEFIKASISVGSSRNRIIFKHVLPNILGRLLVSFVHRIPIVIFAEATLVFLGISVGGDSGNTLGTMLKEGRILEALNYNPMFLISTASVLLIFTLSLQIIANGLRDAFDAKVSA